MQINKSFSEQMQLLSDEVLSNKSNINEVNTGEIDTAKLLLEVAEVHNLHHDIEVLEKENQELKDKLDTANIHIQELENKLKHNARNAGRHKLNTTKKFNDFCSLLQESKTKEEIMLSLHISKRTYYYYLKEYNLVKNL